MTTLPLPGCTPEPLMSYLKALGVFRLVAEQADPDARLSWNGGLAQLDSKLDRDGLMTFFLDEYRPTPIVTPWNSASGFAPTKADNKAPKDKAAREAIERIAGTTINRFQNYREAIGVIRHTARGDEDSKSWKQDYFCRCRAELPDSVVGWLDTCFALTNDSLPPFLLLGSGGNDGVTDFGSLYMQRLTDVLIQPQLGSTPRQFLNSALFADVEQDGRLSGERPPSLLQDTVGQFNPGGIGGANATQGDFEAKSIINPWDFVLMVEGTLLFAGAVARRMGSNTAKAVFPFTVESVIVGNGSFCEKEARIQGKEPPNSGELWVPLWKRAASFAEVKHLFAEGRAQLGRQQARNSIEFALSVCTLGVSRGIESFVRFGFLRRNGKAFLATPLGRLNVEPRPRAELLTDSGLVRWLDKLRDACRENDGKKEKVPARYKTVLRQIDRAMFQFANRSERGNDAKYLIDVLRAVGRAEQTIATQGLSFFKDKKYGWRIYPLRDLDSQWLEQIKDTPEFRLAASLAGIREVVNAGKMQVGRLRHYMEAVEGERFVNWTKSQNFKTSSAVWSNRSCVANLAAVFRRRQMEAFRGGLVGVPLNSPVFARLDDVIAFLNGQTDDYKLSDLLWALIGVEYPSNNVFTDVIVEAIPFEFGVPRLLIQERCFQPHGGSWRITTELECNAKPDSDVFHILSSGRANAVAESVDRAARRLKSGGLLVTGYRNRRQAGKALGIQSSIDAERLLASMLFPLCDRDLKQIANIILYPPTSKE